MRGCFANCSIFNSILLLIADVTVGFEQNYTVNEDVGSFQACFRVFNPPDNQELTISLDLVVDTNEGSAGTYSVYVGACVVVSSYINTQSLADKVNTYIRIIIVIRRQKCLSLHTVIIIIILPSMHGGPLDSFFNPLTTLRAHAWKSCNSVQTLPLYYLY